MYDILLCQNVTSISKDIHISLRFTLCAFVIHVCIFVRQNKTEVIESNKKFSRHEHNQDLLDFDFDLVGLDITHGT